jgi:hypothetical protein
MSKLLHKLKNLSKKKNKKLENEKVLSIILKDDSPNKIFDTDPGLEIKRADSLPFNTISHFPSQTTETDDDSSREIAHFNICTVVNSPARVKYPI